MAARSYAPKGARTHGVKFAEADNDTHATLRHEVLVESGNCKIRRQNPGSAREPVVLTSLFAQVQSVSPPPPPSPARLQKRGLAAIRCSTFAPCTEDDTLPVSSAARGKGGRFNAERQALLVSRSCDYATSQRHRCAEFCEGAVWRRGLPHVPQHVDTEHRLRQEERRLGPAKGASESGLCWLLTLVF